MVFPPLFVHPPKSFFSFLIIGYALCSINSGFIYFSAMPHVLCAFYSLRDQLGEKGEQARISTR
jgi:hypothetical protein